MTKALEAGDGQGRSGVERGQGLAEGQSMGD